MSLRDSTLRWLVLSQHDFKLDKMTQVFNDIQMHTSSSREIQGPLLADTPNLAICK